jgi:hypothetical protein
MVGLVAVESQHSMDTSTTSPAWAPVGTGTVRVATWLSEVPEVPEPRNAGDEDGWT